MTDMMTDKAQTADSENELVLLPFYLLLDESTSMDGARIDSINALLPELYRSLREHPAVSDVVRLAVVAFSEVAHDTRATILDLPTRHDWEAAQLSPTFQSTDLSVRGANRPSRKEELHMWKTCPSCRGSKRCITCGGAGVLDHGRRCAGCGGSGACGYCRGRGQVPK